MRTETNRWDPLVHPRIDVLLVAIGRVIVCVRFQTYLLDRVLPVLPVLRHHIAMVTAWMHPRRLCRPLIGECARKKCDAEKKWNAMAAAKTAIVMIDIWKSAMGGPEAMNEDTVEIMTTTGIVAIMIEIETEIGITMTIGIEGVPIIVVVVVDEAVVLVAALARVDDTALSTAAARAAEEERQMTVIDEAEIVEVIWIITNIANGAAVRAVVVGPEAEAAAQNGVERRRAKNRRMRLGCTTRLDNLRFAQTTPLNCF